MLQQQPLQQQQPQQRPLPPPMPAMLPSGPEDDFFKFRIDGSDILADIEHQLKGEMFVPGKGYVEKFDRWINDEGINKVLHVIYACGINKNTFLGNLTKDEIMFKCKTLKKKLALLFFKKYQNYDIPKEMRNLLITTIVNTVHSGLSRSEDGKEADQISTAAQRYEVFQHQEEQKRGLAGRIPFFGRRGGPAQ